jgi:hypothetical protein
MTAVRIPEREDATGLAGGGWRGDEEQGSGKSEDENDSEGFLHGVSPFVNASICSL